MKKSRLYINKKIIIGIIITVAGIFSWDFFFVRGGTQGFISAYEAYDVVSLLEENAAHIPGNGGNTSRQKLNDILSRVLTENLSPEERQKLSEEGLVLADTLRSQIDAIGEEGKKTEITSATLRLTSKKVGGFFTKRKVKNIIVLAEERAHTIKEVEEMSYEINRQLEDIFRGIIADRGALTKERISALNQDLPEAEKQFDRLAESYRKLDEIEKKIDIAFLALSMK